MGRNRGIVSIVPVGIYGLISVRHGSFWLPNSVLMKGTLPTSGPITILNQAVFKLYKAPHLVPLFVLAVALYLFRRERLVEKWERGQILLIIFITTMILHLCFASVGWFYRYEAYLVALAILAIGTLLFSTGGPDLKYRGRTRSGFASLALSLVVIAIMLLAYRGGRSLVKTPQASNGVYRQQYQMARFLRDYYQGASIAANDIGAINYFADIHCLDLWALGSVEVARYKLKGQFNAQRLEELVKQHQVKIAIVYAPKVFGRPGAPEQWRMAAQWKTPDCFMCGYDTVSFYAVDPSEIDSLSRNLQEFSMRLPPGVKQVVKYPP